MKEKIIYFLLVLILTILIIDIPSYILYFVSNTSDLVMPENHWSNIIIPVAALYLLLIVLGSILSLKWYRLAVLLLIIIITPVNIFISGSYLYSDYFMEYNMVTNSLVEKLSIIDIIFNFKIIILILQFIIPFIILWKIKPITFSKKYVLGPIAAISIILIILSVFKQEIYSSIPFIDTVKTYVSVFNDKKEYKKEEHNYSIKHNNQESLEVVTKLNNSRQQIFVLVIGSCQTKKHFSLYGYPRNTTPLLNELQDKLYLFTNVSAADDNKSTSISNMLSLYYNENNKYNIVNIIDLFKSAGFQTYWLSNNYMYEKDNIYNSIVGSSADEYLFTDNGLNMNSSTQDEVLVEYYDKIIHNDIEKKFIVLNLSGSCGNLTEEYNEEYNYFYNKFADEKETIINNYDNTIVQADYILNRIIEGLEISDSEAYMLYLSDTGINIENNQTEVTDIPFILWLSEEYKKTYAETAEILKNNTDRKYNTSYLFHSLLDLSQITYEKKEEDKSIFSKKPDKTNK